MSDEKVERVLDHAREQMGDEFNEGLLRAQISRLGPGFFLDTLEDDADSKDAEKMAESAVERLQDKADEDDAGN